MFGGGTLSSEGGPATFGVNRHWSFARRSYIEMAIMASTRSSRRPSAQREGPSPVTLCSWGGPLYIAG